MSEPRDMPAEHHAAPLRAVIVFMLTLLPLALATHRGVFMAGNDASRLAQIEAIVDHGQTHIDGTRYAWTVDRVTIGEHTYSNKPPVLSLAGAGVYWVMQQVTGWTFATAEASVVYWLTLLLVGVPTAVLVVCFDRALLWHDGIGAMTRVMLTASLAFGTILTTFSTTMNNHTVAAALLFLGFIAARSGAGLMTGLFAALAVCVDIVPGLVLGPVLLSMLVGRAGLRGLLRAGVTLALGAAVFCAANWYVVGSWLPAKMVRGAVDRSNVLPGDDGPGAVLGVLLPDRWMYPLECLFGSHGFFTVSPVLVFAAVGLGMALHRPAARLRRGETVGLAAAVGVIVLGHILLVGSYGGWSYGFRYLIPVIPLLLFFTPVVFMRIASPRGRAMLLAAYALVLAVSVLLTWIGAYHPWPPAYEQDATANTLEATVTNPIGGNAAAWLHAHHPQSSLTRAMMRRFISDDPRRAYAYLHLFYMSKADQAEANALRRRVEAGEHLTW